VVLQYKLGAKNAGTFDVGCACASFPPLIAIGSGLIATNPAIKTILGRTQMRREKGTFFHWHAAPLGCNRNRGLADLGEQQLIYVVCREAVFGGDALE
jgi:hypothetical protein